MVTPERPRCAFVTGASRGIGLAVARALADTGVRIALGYASDEAAASRALGALPGTGHVLVRADIGNPEEAERAVNEAASGLGGLDILVNNAAVRGHHPPVAADYDQWQEEWRRILDVNLVGPANLCFLAARHMIDAGGGRIVNISSRGAFRGEPDMPAYGASKAGLNALTQSLALALGPHGIAVTAVAPGFVQTDGTAGRLAGPEGDHIRAQSPLGRVARPEEVAAAVVYLCSENAAFATGAVIDVNGASYLRT